MCVCLCVHSGLHVPVWLFVPVLIRIYTTEPRFSVVSCIAHYCYLPRGWKLKPETNSEPCAVKCTREISVARKSECVRGVNLRLSQPEATMGCCAQTVPSHARSVEGRGQTETLCGGNWEILRCQNKRDWDRRRRMRTANTMLFLFLLCLDQGSCNANTLGIQSISTVFLSVQREQYYHKIFQLKAKSLWFFIHCFIHMIMSVCLLCLEHISSSYCVCVYWCDLAWLKMISQLPGSPVLPVLYLHTFILCLLHVCQVKSYNLACASLCVLQFTLKAITAFICGLKHLKSCLKQCLWFQLKFIIPSRFLA